MKVLVVTPSYPRYEGDYHGAFIDALNQHISKKINIKVLAPRTRTQKEYATDFPVKRFAYLPSQRMEWLAEQTMKNAPIHHLVQLPAYMTSAYLNIIKERTDLIHTHFAIPLGYLAAINPTRTPQIVTCHGSDITLPYEKQIYRPFTKYVLKKTRKTITVSNYIRTLAIRLGSDPQKTETVYLGVDTKKFKPGKKDTNTITIGTLGRMIPEKRIEDILESMRVLEGKLDCRLLIGGDGPHLSFLKELAKKMGLINVRFLGRVHDAQMFLGSCDLFVLASTREGLSISLQEAMSAGCVPVAVNGYGCDELISSGVNGFLFKPRDVESLVCSIVEASVNLRYGRHARETVVRDFNMEKNAGRYVEIYHEVVG